MPAALYGLFRLSALMDGWMDGLATAVGLLLRSLLSGTRPTKR